MNNLETGHTVSIASVRLVVATSVHWGPNGNKYCCFSALLEYGCIHVCLN